MSRLVTKVRRLVAARIPDAFLGIEEVVTAVSGLIEHYFVENKELGLWSEVRSVADAGGLQVSFRLLGDVPGISRVKLPCNRVYDVADKADGWILHEGIHECGLCVRNDEHVGSMDCLPTPDRRTVKSESFLENLFLQFCHGYCKVLPDAGEIKELEVCHDSLVFLGHLDYIFWCHYRSSYFLLVIKIPDFRL